MSAGDTKAEMGPDGAGPIRNHKSDDRDRKGPIAAPVKSACTFCRSRKSRCDGNNPCSACIGRGRVDDCIYTVSRRGGKPKAKIDPTQDLQAHLNKLFALTDMPYAFRRPDGLAGSAAHGPATGIDNANFGAGQPSSQSQVDMFGMPPYPTFDQATLQQPPPPGPMDPASTYLAGGFARYMLPDSQQQSQMQAQQPFYQQYQQPQQIPSIPNQQFSQPTAQVLPHLQQDPLSAQNFQASQFGQAVSPQNAQVFATPSPQQGSLQHWSPADASMAAYHASSVSVAPSSSPSVSSRRQSIGSPFDAASTTAFSNSSLDTASLKPSSVRHLLVDYYRYLYRFIPVLPPPQHLDVLVSYFKPDSSFIYALQCVLPLLRDEIQPIGAFHKLSGSGINFGTEEKKAALRERTLTYERKATEGIERLISQAEQDGSDGKLLEAVQTLSVMIVYEYGSGRPIKARLKADQALGLAMKQDLHKLGQKSNQSQANAARNKFCFASSSLHSVVSTGVDAQTMLEVRKRCWWSVWSLVLWAAYNTGRIPTIRADDPRVKSEVPRASDPDVWTSNIGSLQALLLVQDRVLALAHFVEPSAADAQYRPTKQDPSTSPKEALSPQNSPFAFGRLGIQRAVSVGDDVPATFSTLPTNASRREILDSMLEIDQFLQDRIRDMETTHTPDSPMPNEVPQSGTLGHVEQELEDSLRMAAAVQLYTSSLTLHIGQAFQGASLFERKLCFLNSTNDLQDGVATAVCQQPMEQFAQDDFLDMSQFGLADFSSNPQMSMDAVPLATATQQDLYARGPFLPRLSLQRCVHASRKLLDIAKRRHGQSVNPNPFNCCSFVLISFVLLMQALAVHGGFADVQDDDDAPMEDNMDGKYANDHLQSLINHGFEPGANFSDNGVTRTGALNGDPEKQAKLRDIWGRVREAHETLTDLGKHWEAVVPMADEVSLCLETSQLLLSTY